MVNNRKQASSKEELDDKPQLNFLYGLKDISLLIYERKISIILIILGLLAGAVLYSISLQPIYRATANVIPPSDTRVSTLSFPGCPSWSGGDIFQIFRQHILDPSRREEFFEQPDILKLTQSKKVKSWVWDRRAKAQPKVEIDFDKNDRLTLHLDGTNAELVEKLTERYIADNQKTATDQVLADVLQCLDVRKNILTEDIAETRKNAKEQLNDEIQRLEEAKHIAEEIGQYEFDPRAPETPLYARGVKALDAEIRALRDRSMTDSVIDAFSPAISRDKSELSTIEDKKVTNNWKSYVISAQVQSEPYADPEPVFPKRPLIWLYGLIIGLFVSIFYAIAMNKIRIIRENRKK